MAALPRDLRGALDAALAASPDIECWAVGGAVRDVALGRPLVDLDLVTTSAPDVAASAASHALGGAVTQHDRFGTATVSSLTGRIDFARSRTETYARPGALPEPTLDAAIEADLARRDFTVNAIAVCLAGNREGDLLDPYGGLEDLRHGRLRILHAASFRDDATRIWRGARYAVRLDLHPEEDTLAALGGGLAWLAAISGERLWAEFVRTAEEPAPGRVLALLEDWGALGATVEGLHLTPATQAALLRRRGPIPVAVLAAVLCAPLEPGTAAAVIERFGAPREVARAVEDARALLECSEATPDALAPLEGLSTPGRTAARWLAPAPQRALQRELGRWERTRPALTPTELEQLGIAPGPAMGEWLRRLRRERFLGTLHTRAQARRLVRDSLASVTPDPPSEVQAQRTLDDNLDR